MTQDRGTEHDLIKITNLKSEENFKNLCITKIFSKNN